MAFLLKVLFIMIITQSYFLEEFNKKDQCLNYIRKSANQIDLFESFINRNFFKESNFDAIDE